MVKKEKNWNYKLETNDFSSTTDGVYPLFILLSDGDWTVSAFCGSPRKKCVGRDETVRKMFPYSWKETGYTKAWKEGEVERGCTPVCTLLFFANAFAFPNLKVVSHVEGKKKARVKAGDIFYGIPGSPCPLSISLSRLIYSTSPSPSAFPQLKTFDFPRRSIITKKKKRIIRANEFLFFFLVSQCSTIHERTREFRVRRLKKRDIHWLKILLF